MKKYYSSFLFILLLILIFKTPVYASGSSSDNPCFMGDGKKILAPIPQKVDFPYWDDAQNNYVGILIERFQPTVINSNNNADYTSKVEVDGRSQWFVPVAQATGTNFEIKWDHQETKNTVLGGKEQLDLAGVTHNIVQFNFKFKFIVYHVFRLSNGEYRQSEGKVIYYMVNRIPELSLTAPADNQAFSEVPGHNLIPVTGIVKDEDVEDTISVKYTIDGLAEHQNKTAATLTADGTNQPFSYNIPVDSSIPQGAYTLRVWAEDDKGGISTQETCTIRIDKTAPNQPTISANTNWTNAASVTVTITHGSDIGGSGVKQTEYRLTGVTSQGWTTYAGGFNISNAGQTTIEARTIDNVGNISSLGFATVKIDRTVPVITANPDKRDTWDTTAVNINVSFTDNRSGLQTRQYELTESINPTDSWSTASNNDVEVMVNTEGEWYLHVNAVDIAGNTEQATFGPYRYFDLDAPSGVAAVNPTTSTIDVQWNEVEDHEYQVQIKDDNNVIVTASDWSVASPYTFNNLQPNTRYIPEVKSRKHGIETNFISGIAQYTDAEPVRTAAFEAMDKAIKITLDIADTENPEGTKYIIKNMDTEDTSDTSGEIEETWTNTGLINDMVYSYMAKVINKNGKEAEWFLIGTGHTAITEVIVPPDWEDPVGGLTPINLPDDFNPETIGGKAVDFNGTPAIIVKGRYINISIDNVQNAKKYAISLEGFGYGDWKPLDASGSFSESIFINQPGLYKVHVKFQNTYGGESKSYVRNFLVDWISPDIITTSKIKGQTATTDGTFAVTASGTDNLSPVLYNSESSWQWFIEGDNITANNITLDNLRKDVLFKFSDLNGNVTETTHKVWAINK